LNRQELIKAVAQDCNLTSVTVKRAIISAFKVIENAVLSSSDKVQIADFGTFKLRVNKPRKGINPVTGVAINIPGSETLAFRPAKRKKQG